MMTTNPPASPRFTFAVSELLVVVAINATLGAFLLQVVNAARSARNLPRFFEWLEPLYDGRPFTFALGVMVVATTAFALAVAVLRRILPQTIRKHFPWRKSRKANSHLRPA